MLVTAQNKVSVDILADLDKILHQGAAQLIQTIERANKENYLNFLDYMYHYTKHSEDLLLYAQKQFNEPDLIEYFAEQAHEERGHYLLAKHDLKEFDKEPKEHEIASISAYNDYWISIKKADRYKFLGIQYIVENLARNVAGAIHSMINRLNLERKQATWLLVHLEADISHGDEAAMHVRNARDEQWDTILKGAQDIMPLWLAVFKESFEKKWN